MKTIYKYPIEITDKQTLPMPVGANILTVQVQNGNPFIWAMVDTEAPIEGVAIIVYGTEHPIDESLNLEYIGTFQSNGKCFVFHVLKRFNIKKS